MLMYEFMSKIPANTDRFIPAIGAVLIVEDDECLRTIIGTMFSLQRRTVYTASDGEEGEQQFLNHQEEILLVVVDLGLPKIEGVELVRRFRILKPSIKVIATSGYNDKKFIEEILQNGVDAFLKKPFNQTELLALIRQFLE